MWKKKIEVVSIHCQKAGSAIKIIVLICFGLGTGTDAMAWNTDQLLLPKKT